MPGFKPQSGFTLIEVLVSIAIFAVVVAAINGIFYGALHLQMNTTTTIEESLPADRVITIMKRDIANIVQPGMIAGSVSSSSASGGSAGGASANSVAGLTGPISLELYTSTGTITDDEPWGDVQKVDYSLQPSLDNARGAGKDLVRSISRNLLTTATETPEEQRLLEDVEKLQISFFDGTNWVETWGSNSSTNASIPAAIRVQVAMAVDKFNRVKPPIEFLVPVMVTTPAQ